VATFHLTNLKDRVLIRLADMNLIGTPLQYMNLQLTCGSADPRRRGSGYFRFHACRVRITTIISVPLGSRNFDSHIE